jgi:hypothetical protein
LLLLMMLLTLLMMLLMLMLLHQHAAAQVAAPAGARASLAFLLLVLPGDDYGGKKTRRLRGVESDGIGAGVLGVWGLESVLDCKFGTLEGGSCSVLKKQVIPTPLR